MEIIAWGEAEKSVVLCVVVCSPGCVGTWCCVGRKLNPSQGLLIQESDSSMHLITDRAGRGISLEGSEDVFTGIIRSLLGSAHNNSAQEESLIRLPQLHQFKLHTVPELEVI